MLLRYAPYLSLQIARCSQSPQSPRFAPACLATDAVILGPSNATCAGPEPREPPEDGHLRSGHEETKKKIYIYIYIYIYKCNNKSEEDVVECRMCILLLHPRCIYFQRLILQSSHDCGKCRQYQRHGFSSAARPGHVSMKRGRLPCR